jgi:hypothetical protein
MSRTNADKLRDSMAKLLKSENLQSAYVHNKINTSDFKFVSNKIVF